MKPFPLPVYSNELGRLPTPFGPQSHSPPDQAQYWYPGAHPDVQGTFGTFGAQGGQAFPLGGIAYDNQTNLGYSSAFVSPTGDGTALFDGGLGGGADEGIGMARFGGDLDTASMQALIDSDTIAMWSTAPAGFECVVFFSCLSLYPPLYLRLPLCTLCRVFHYSLYYVFTGWMTGALTSRMSVS